MFFFFSFPNPAYYVKHIKSPKLHEISSRFASFNIILNNKYDVQGKLITSNMTEKQVPSGGNIISGTLRVFLYFHTMYLQVRNINLEKNSRLSQWALCFHTMQCTFKSEIYRVHLLGVSKEASSYFNIWCLSFLITLSTLRLRGELWRSLLLSFDRLSQFFQRLL